MAHQPMQSACGRYLLSYNGEIYNYRALKKQCETLFDYPFKSSSDTEVLLALIENMGVKETLSVIIGMFSFACLDLKEDRLYLARDRMGEKPLYYGWLDNHFIFASELKALVAFRQKPLDLAITALNDYLRYSYIPSPLSIYKDIYQCPPGHWLMVPLKRYQERPTTEAYWQYHLNLQNSETKPIDNQDFAQLLKTVVQDNMVADVPIGAFLSGGIDSSLVTAMMQSISDKPIHTFSIGFNDKDYDEAPYARGVAQHLKTHHQQYYISKQEIIDAVINMSDVYDEPFADASGIPTYLVSKFASRHVKVALTGDGGDELFAGYNRYIWADKIWQKLGVMPLGLRRALSNILLAMPKSMVLAILRCLPANFRHKAPLEKFDKFCLALKAVSPQSLYQQLIQTCLAPLDILNPDYLRQSSVDYSFNENISFIDNMMLGDATHYLPDDILVKVDRASMANHLETRAPFLDSRIVTVAQAMPLTQKLANGVSKKILRELLYQYVPKALIERPKMGFAIPIGDYLRHELKPWADDLLNPSNRISLPYFNAKAVTKLWQGHLKGDNSQQHLLWNILMFHAWHQRWQKTTDIEETLLYEENIT